MPPTPFDLKSVVGKRKYNSSHFNLDHYIKVSGQLSLSGTYWIEGWLGFRAGMDHPNPHFGVRLLNQICNRFQSPETFASLGYYAA
jgi:hypothetical protein